MFMEGKNAAVKCLIGTRYFHMIIFLVYLSPKDKKIGGGLLYSSIWNFSMHKSIFCIVIYETLLHLNGVYLYLMKIENIMVVDF